MNRFLTVKNTLAERKIILVIIVSVLTAIVMTTVSMYLYRLDDVSRLDVSLPDREQVRPTTTGSIVDNVDSFSANGAVNASSLNQFQEMFDVRRNELGSLGRYDGNALDFESLRITTNE